MYAQIDDPQPWEDNARPADRHEIPFAQNIRDHWQRVTTDDVALSPMFVDVQFDRSRENALGETPMLSVVSQNDEGIVVRGWKAIGTSIAFVNELLIGNLWQPGKPRNRRFMRSSP